MKKQPISVILTDTHETKNNIELVESIFEQAGELALSLGINEIYHAGDWFTDRVGQNLSTLVSLDRILSKLEDKGLKVLGIAGNHDKTSQDSEDSYLNIFRNRNLTIFPDIGWKINKEYDMFVGFLGYFTNSYKDRLKELTSIAKSKRCSKNILITHKAFNGVRNNDGSVVEDGVSVKDVNFWDKVLVGHYHDYSEVGDNIFYIGSAYQANFGENITDKGFTILYSDCSIKKVRSEFPKYIKVEISADDVDSIENELEVHSNSDDNVRFVFRGKKTDLDNINLSKFSDVGIDCKFESEEINSEILNIESENFQTLDSKSIMKHFLNYCKIQKIGAEERKFGLKIMNNDFH